MIHMYTYQTHKARKLVSSCQNLQYIVTTLMLMLMLMLVLLIFRCWSGWSWQCLLCYNNLDPLCHLHQASSPPLSSLARDWTKWELSVGTADAISQCHAMMMKIALKTTLRWKKREIGERCSIRRPAFHPPGSNLWQVQCTRVGLGRWVDKGGGGLSKCCTRPTSGCQ